MTQEQDTIAEKVRLQSSPAATAGQVQQGLRSGEGIIRIDTQPSEKKIKEIIEEFRKRHASKRQVKKLEKQLRQRK